MKHKKPGIMALLALLLASLSCNLPSSGGTQPDAPPTQPEVSPTPQGLPTDLPTETAPVPTLEPTSTPPTLETPTSAPAGAHLPAGFAAAPTTGETLTLYDTQASPLAMLTAPHLNGGQPAFFHLAGPLSGGSQALPLIYFSYDGGGQLLTSLNGAPTPLRSEPSFYALVGAPGQPLIAFTTIDFASDGLNSTLYLSDLASLPNARPLLTMSDSEGYAVKPLAIVIDGAGSPAGIYYTSVPYGIGGDIVFEPRRTLNYLELASMRVTNVLGITFGPCGFSPDLSWLAYSSSNAPRPLSIAPVNNLAGAISLPLLPTSDRGAGDAVFSPDNQYLAWKEGSGFMMAEVPNFHATIRIASLSGQVTAEIPDAALNGIAGASAVTSVRPIGWLDNQTLILEIHLEDWEDVHLLRVNYDGSGLAYLAGGHFLGFVYP